MGRQSHGRVGICWLGPIDVGFHRHSVRLPTDAGRQGLVPEILAQKGLAEPTNSRDFPGLGRSAQDFGYFEKAYSPSVTGNAGDWASEHRTSASPPPAIPTRGPHTGLTARVENFARTIGAQIFGKW